MSTAVLAGCSGNNPQPSDDSKETRPAAESPSPSDSPSPSNTPTKPSNAQLEADLTKTVKGYWAAAEEAYQKADPSPLEKWAFIPECADCKSTADLIESDKKKGQRYELAGHYKVTEPDLAGAGEDPQLRFILTTPPGKVVGKAGNVIYDIKTQKFKYAALFGKGRDGRWYIKYLKAAKLG